MVLKVSVARGLVTQGICPFSAQLCCLVKSKGIGKYAEAQG